MRTISDLRGEAALDALADLLEPASELMMDAELADAAKSGDVGIRLISLAAKKHPKALIKIMAVFDGEDPETYAEKVSLLTLPAKLAEIKNNPEIMRLFGLQGQTNQSANSGSAMANTMAKETPRSSGGTTRQKQKSTKKI